MTDVEMLLGVLAALALVGWWLEKRHADGCADQLDAAWDAEAEERGWREEAETALRRARADARAGRHPVRSMRLVEPLPPAGSVFDGRRDVRWPKDSA